MNDFMRLLMSGNWRWSGVIGRKGGTWQAEVRDTVFGWHLWCEMTPGELLLDETWRLR